jgi:hypothetical protein
MLLSIVRLQGMHSDLDALTASRAETAVQQTLTEAIHVEGRGGL